MLLDLLLGADANLPRVFARNLNYTAKGKQNE
jgi:hypothetical protein